MIFRSAIACILALVSTFAFAEDPFALGVRNTPHLKPAEEQKLFRLPTGFEIQLIAAEPEIQKPLNMAFDARGRLWITDTVEYPYAVPVGTPGRDSIKVIEFDYESGQATKITTFADGLNIPIGLLPCGDGVIAHSIPNIWYFRDTDGDGRCDTREVLYGPFDHSRDTHGMLNAFRRGFDGWIYACHGFNNDSRVKGKDGHEVHMQSGNTFRFRPDGSRIEHFTHGQVNPFGMCFDDQFNIFTADCHSKPVTQLLQGGYYPSFGKPHDGLGFVPSMMEHSHGSTAICGIAWANGDNFPPEFRGQLLSGNVMTSRINRNSLVRHGSTLTCQEEPDFLSAGDPWFRPVDLHIGPDGALYIADFYNRIIGHYEVPLTHPERDRTSGRLWRVVYKGGNSACKPATRQKDLTIANRDELIVELQHPVLTQRLLALGQLVDRADAKSFAEIAKQLETCRDARSAAMLWWAAVRIDPAAARELRTERSLLEMPTFAVHLLKSCEVLGDLNTPHQVFGPVGLGSPDVWKAAAVSLAQNNDKDIAETTLILLDNLDAVPADDTQLQYALRMCLRNNLALIDDLSVLTAMGDGYQRSLEPIALATRTACSAEFLLHRLSVEEGAADLTVAHVSHVARFLPASRIPDLVSVARRHCGADIDSGFQILQAMQQGFAERGVQSPEHRDWALELCEAVLKTTSPEEKTWEFVAIGDADAENPWTLQSRSSDDGNKDSLFYSSLVKGEQRTGVYRSRPFPLPGRLSFWCAGHTGPPPMVLDLNYIRLRDAKTGELLVEARPPRNDVARRIEWNLAKFAEREGYIELVDGDAGNGYAWLAVGRFSVDSLNPNAAAQRLGQVSKLAQEMKLKSLAPQLARYLVAGGTEPSIRGTLAAALVSLEPDARAAALVRLFDEPQLDPVLRAACGEAIVNRDADDMQKSLVAGLKLVPARVQTAIAEQLAGDEAGVKLLLHLVEAGQLSPRLLQSPVVAQKLAAHKPQEYLDMVKELTSKLPPMSDDIDRMIAAARKAYSAAKTNSAEGAKVFKKNCAICHQISGQGAVVGPQLDGIGGRGLERLLEDVLDPNRNVDIAFRTSTIVMQDGRILTGLVRRVEGEQLMVVDGNGKEFRVTTAEIDERTQTAVSLMPANLIRARTSTGEDTMSLSDTDFNNLLSYLLEQKVKRE